MKKPYSIFLQNLSGKIILDEGEDATGSCIFDSAPNHRGVEDMNCNGMFEMKRLPEYIPFLSMVENAISFSKSAIKRNLTERMDAFQNPIEIPVRGRSLPQYRFESLRG